MRRIGCRPWNGPRKPSGASLLELLIVMAVLSLIMAAVYAVYQAGSKVFFKASQLSDRQEQSRTALNLMLRDIRQLGYDPSGAVSTLSLGTPLLTANQSTLEFVGDVSRDGVTDKVKYAYDSTAKTITRQVAAWNSSTSSFGSYGNAAAVATTAGALTFTFYDDAGPPNTALTTLPLSSTDRQKVKRIVITITMATDKSNPQQVVLKSGVRPRNL